MVLAMLTLDKHRRQGITVSHISSDVPPCSFTDKVYTVFPRNLAAATFNFVVQFGAATFRGRRLKYS